MLDGSESFLPASEWLLDHDISFSPRILNFWWECLYLFSQGAAAPRVDHVFLQIWYRSQFRGSICGRSQSSWRQRMGHWYLGENVSFFRNTSTINEKSRIFQSGSLARWFIEMLVIRIHRRSNWEGAGVNCTHPKFVSSLVEICRKNLPPWKSVPASGEKIRFGFVRWIFLMHLM